MPPSFGVLPQSSSRTVMAEVNQDPVRVMVDAFKAFIHHAAEAHSQHNHAARDIWLQAANHLVPLTEASVCTLIQNLALTRQLADAETIARAYACLEPNRASAHFHFGFVLQLANRHAEAIAPYRAAFLINPELHSLRNNLASALLQGEPTSREACELLETSLNHDPNDANCWVNLAMLHMARFEIEKALEAGTRAVELAPNNDRTLNNLGLHLREAQRWDDAERCARAALALAPDSASHRLNFGILRLMRGDFEGGWPGHEFRWDGSGELAGKRPMFQSPMWSGQPLAGKTLLLWGEQGMGDLLQFCRYVPMLADEVHRQGGRLVWNSFPQMGDLLRRSLAHHADEFSVVIELEKLPKYDYEFPMVSLPMYFQTSEATIPEAPYLQADPHALETWRDRLKGERRLKVGLTWTGSATHKRNPFRRVGIERYVQKFGGLKNVAFYSLQPGAEDEVAQARAAGLDIVDYTSEFKTFDDTAAFVSALDLVVSVCTSVAHLSGALGQRTWVLLDVHPHWVWLLDRTDSPWYPATTLYRQKKFGEWDPALDALTSDLAKLAGKDKRKA
jgi:tetratricopeptide (TPR) repeat protein